jgi:23S rRNA pseudouridine1911/1915/1917 synthase
MKRSFDIVYEDRDILVAYKKSGLLTVATDKDDRHTLYHYVRDYLNRKRQRVFIVHRLDRDTSGLVLFAKSIEVKEDLQEAFSAQAVGRYYEAVVRERLPVGKEMTVDEYLAFDEESGRAYVTHDREEGKEAITRFRVDSVSSLGSVLSIQILTGRRNQIRVALATLHLTLIGDKKYSPDRAKTMMLNEYEIDLPEDFPLRKKSFFTQPLWLSAPSEDSLPE